MTSTENVYSKFSMNNPCKPVHGNQSATASDCSESTSSQSLLKRFQLLAQDMMEHSSAAAVAVSNTADTELVAYFADCKDYSENSGLKFCVMNANKYPLLDLLAQDLLSSAAASEAYVERVFSVCGELTAGKRNQLTKSLEKRLSVNISGSPAR